jgi:hypothetical protein
MSITIGREKIGGTFVDIEVESGGRFTAALEGEEYQADTKAGLVEILRKAAKRQQKRTPVEITLLDYDHAWQQIPTYQRKRVDETRLNPEEPEAGYVTHAQLRGQNPRTRALLLTIGTEKVPLDYSYHSTPIARRLSEAEVAEFQRLKAAIRDAEAAYAAWEAGVRFDVKAWLAKETEEGEATSD